MLQSVSFTCCLLAQDTILFTTGKRTVSISARFDRFKTALDSESKKTVESVGPCVCIHAREMRMVFFFIRVSTCLSTFSYLYLLVLDTSLLFSFNGL